MPAFVVAIFFMMMMAIFLFNVLHRRSGGCFRLASDCRASRAANGRAQNCAILPAHVISHRRTGSAAQRSADHGSAVSCMGIHAGREEQGDC